MRCSGCNGEISQLTTKEPAKFAIPGKADSRNRVELVPDNSVPEFVTHECGTSFEVFRDFDDHLYISWPEPAKIFVEAPS